MRSKAVALFLTLGLTSTLVACNAGNTGSQEGGEQGPTKSNPKEPNNGEGGESSVLPLPLRTVIAEDLG